MSIQPRYALRRSWYRSICDSCPTHAEPRMGAGRVWQAEYGEYRRATGTSWARGYRGSWAIADFRISVSRDEFWWDLHADLIPSRLSKKQLRYPSCARGMRAQPAMALTFFSRGRFDDGTNFTHHNSSKSPKTISTSATEGFHNCFYTIFQISFLEIL